MAKTIKIPVAQAVTLFLTLISVGLFIGGFLTPPMGVIDGSVLTAAGILFAFAALWVTAHAVIEEGKVGKLKRGNTEIEITDTDNKDDA
ncbi:MAG: hypothetical protein IIX13_09455 [Bacteroidales bacterium]|nr:hypothetical protein [Bacteroidales bacterium]